SRARAAVQPKATGHELGREQFRAEQSTPTEASKSTKKISIGVQPRNGNAPHCHDEGANKERQQHLTPLHSLLRLCDGHIQIVSSATQKFLFCSALVLAALAKHRHITQNPLAGQTVKSPGFDS